MAKSKITGKTFDEMLSESTELDLSAKFKDIIYEFSNDVHAMGIVIYTYEEGSAKFLFKDPAFTQPVTDYELLAMYLDEVVATRLADENTSLERCRDLEAEKVKYLEYKEGDFVKRFYKIGDYYSGGTFSDLFGFVPDLPLVGTAVVGKDKIAGEEATVLFEASFHIDDTAEDSYYCFDESVPSEYGTAPGLQDIMQITSLNEVKVTFDGNEFIVPISSSTTQSGNPSYSFGNSKENGFNAILIKWKPSSASDYYDRFDIWTYSDGDHTIKVETV